jgi:hypothetical protein
MRRRGVTALVLALILQTAIATSAVGQSVGADTEGPSGAPPEENIASGGIEIQVVADPTEVGVEQATTCNLGLTHTVGNPPGPGYTVRVNASATCQIAMSEIFASATLRTGAGSFEAYAEDRCFGCFSVLARAVKNNVVPGSQHIAQGHWELTLPPGWAWVYPPPSGCTIFTPDFMACSAQYTFTASK